MEHPCFGEITAMRREMAAEQAAAREQRQQEIEILERIATKLTNGLGREIGERVIETDRETRAEMCRQIGQLRRALIALGVIIALGLAKSAPDAIAQAVKLLGSP